MRPPFEFPASRAPLRNAPLPVYHAADRFLPVPARPSAPRDNHEREGRRSVFALLLFSSHPWPVPSALRATVASSMSYGSDKFSEALRLISFKLLPDARTRLSS